MSAMRPMAMESYVAETFTMHRILKWYRAD